MGKQLVFSVYDSKAEYYGRPFFMDSKGRALRMFSDMANDQETEIGRHPEDFTLFHIADYDSQSGKFENVLTPNSMGVAIEFKKPDDNRALPGFEEKK